MREASVLTLGELLSAVAAHDVVVTGAQLHRWRKFGLIPSPARRSLGRGKGRDSLYPAETVPQLLALVAFLSRSRDLDAARWRLFVEGFTVSMQALRTHLEQLVRDAGARAAAVARGLALDDDDAAAAFEDAIVEPHRKRTSSPVGRVLRKRLRGQRMAQFALLAARISTGLYVEPSDKTETAEDRALVRAVFGGDTDESPHPNTATAAANLLNPPGLGDVLARTSDETLVIARREFLLDVMPLMRAILDAMPGLGAAIALDAVTDPYWPDPNLFLLWLCYRDDPNTRELLAWIHTNLTSNASH